MKIGKYVDLYSKDLQLKAYSESTIKNYCCQIELFLKYFDGVANKPSEINERNLNQGGYKKQNEDSARNYIIGVIAIIIMAIYIFLKYS